MKTSFLGRLALLALAGALLESARAQFPPPGGDGPPPFFRGPGPGGPFGMGAKQKIASKFDKDGDGVLNDQERKEALQFLEKERAEGRGPRGPRRFGGRGRDEEATPGPRVTPSEVKSYPNAGLYDMNVVRTLFLEFKSPNWEKEMAAFKGTDVEMAARLQVDGKTYENVGVHFRGASSFGMVSEGQKRSMNLSMDFADKNQKLYGYTTLNLLNSHEDPSFLRTVLYCQISREYLPAPKANFVKVVVNGESWGVYVNAQQFNKEFIAEWYHTTKGNRWKVQGSPRGRGSLAYLGDQPEKYKSIYSLKSKEHEKAWNDLARFCKTLSETPADKLEAALSPILDVDGALWFLALENTFINNDGYWIRTSDYNIYEDTHGRFHILPHDTNETFSRPGGPGFGGPGGPGGRGFGGPPPGGPRGFGGPPPDGPGGFGGPPPGGGGNGRIRGVELDPLLAAEDASKPLISKLLSVPKWREAYLDHVRTLRDEWLDWDKKLGPSAQKLHDLIAADVKIDTRKLESTEAFEQSLGNGSGEARGFGGGSIPLKAFANQRRAYLLGLPALKK